MEFQGGTAIPVLLAGEGSEEFLAERNSLLSLHRRNFPTIARGRAASGQFERLRGGRQQCLALQQGQKVAIETGVDLQGVAAVLDDVGIHKAWHDALAKQGLAQLLCEDGG